MVLFTLFLHKVVDRHQEVDIHSFEHFRLDLEPAVAGEQREYVGTSFLHLIDLVVHRLEELLDGFVRIADHLFVGLVDNRLQLLDIDEALLPVERPAKMWHLDELKRVLVSVDIISFSSRYFDVIETLEILSDRLHFTVEARTLSAR